MSVNNGGTVAAQCELAVEEGNHRPTVRGGRQQRLPPSDSHPWCLQFFIFANYDARLQCDLSMTSADAHGEIDRVRIAIGGEIPTGLCRSKWGHISCLFDSPVFK